MRSIKSTFSISVTVIIITAVSLSSCADPETKDKHYETFPVTEVLTLDTTTFVDYTAEIVAVQNVEIRSRVSGYLEKVQVDEGQLVKAGQVLFNINNLEYQEELSKSKAQYNNAVAEYNAMKLELKNINLLVEKKVISQTEAELFASKVDAAYAKVEETQAQQAVAQLKVANAEIKAPFTGIVNRIPNRIGSLIEQGTLLTSLSQNNEVFAYFNVSEKEYLNYASSQASHTAKSDITLILANGNEHLFKGQIETIDGEIDKNTGNIAFRARFRNPTGLLKHGSSGKIRVTKTYDDVIIIPQKATFEIQDKMYVYVLDENNVAKATNVVPQARFAHFYIISSGLNSTAKIVFEGIQNMKEGIEINPEFIPMKKILFDLSVKENI